LAETPFVRPASLADEHTGTMEVVQHAVETLEQSGAAFDWTCCIYATAPFLSADYLKEGLLRLKRSGRSFAFSVTSFKLSNSASVANFAGPDGDGMLVYWRCCTP
jgi:pseudaminic acid cytidylyltransferase